MKGIEHLAHARAFGVGVDVEVGNEMKLRPDQKTHAHTNHSETAEPLRRH